MRGTKRSVIGGGGVRGTKGGRGDQQPRKGRLSSSGTVQQVSKQHQWVDLVTMKKRSGFSIVPLMALDASDFIIHTRIHRPIHSFIHYFSSPFYF